MEVPVDSGSGLPGGPAALPKDPPPHPHQAEDRRQRDQHRVPRPQRRLCGHSQVDIKQVSKLTRSVTTCHTACTNIPSKLQNSSLAIRS